MVPMSENGAAARVVPAWQRIVAALANIAARWSLIAIAALLPIFIIPVPWILVGQAKVLLLASLLLITLIAWAIARVAERSLLLPKNVLLLSTTFLPLAYAASALASGASMASFVSGSAEQDTVVGVCLFYTLMMLTALTISRKESAFARILQAFLLGSGVLVVLQIARLIMPTFLTFGGALQGSTASLVGSWHDLGIILGLLVFLGVALYRTPLASGFWKWLIAGTGIAAYLLLFITNETDVWYTLAAAVFFYGGYRWCIAFVRERVSLVPSLARSRTWIAFFAVIGLSLILSPFVYAHLPGSLQIVQTEIRPSWQGTLAIGEKVLSGKSGFIFGSGPNTFAQAWGRFKPASVNTTLFWNIDFVRGVGLVPTSFITVGALGIIAWLLLLGGLAWSMWRFFSDRNSLAPPGRAYTAAALFASLYLTAFLVLYVPGTSVVALTFLFLGFLAALEIARDRKASTFIFGWRHWSEALYALVFLVIIALLSLATATALRATVSNVFLGRAAAYTASGQLAQAGAFVQRAIDAFPSNDGAQRAAVQIGLARLSELVASAKTDDAAKAELQTTLSTTIQHGLAAVSINGGDYQNWLALASLYRQLAGVGVEGASDNARKAYEHAIAENPTNPLLYTQLAQLAISQNDLGAALEDLDRALSLKNDFPAAFYFRSQVEASQKNFVEAEADAAAAADLASADPLGWYNLGSIYYSAGEYASAVSPLEKAASLQSDYADALYMLGLTYYKLGRHDEAIARMQQVADLNPNNASVASALRSFKNAATTTPASAPTRGGIQ